MDVPCERVNAFLLVKHIRNKFFIIIIINNNTAAASSNNDNGIIIIIIIIIITFICVFRTLPNIYDGA